MRSEALERVLQTEAPEWGWSAEAEDRIEADLASASVGAPMVLQADCRTRLCLLRLAFASPAARELFFRNVRGTAAIREMGEFFMYAQDLQDTEVEFYVAREGTLPLVTPP